MEEKKQSVSTTEVRGSPSSQINNNTKRNKNAFPHWDALIQQMDITQNKNMQEERRKNKL